MSDQTVGNILRRHSIPPAPDRKKTTTWKEFIRTHREVLVATDFFTTEVRTKGGLVTFYVLFFLISGQLQSPCGWCDALSPSGLDDPEIARNVTMAEWGFLAPGDYLIHDRDSKFCPAFQRTLEETGVKRVVLPARSPNLNPHAERR